MLTEHSEAGSGIWGMSETPWLPSPVKGLLVCQSTKKEKSHDERSPAAMLAKGSELLLRG